MILVSLATGYLLGSLPTASWIAASRGIDLREAGSGNPGANNARRLGGIGLAAAVLAVEMAKGFAATELGGLIGDDAGAVAAAAGAVAGNIYNVWYRMKGGKGLGITAGVLLAAWPPAVPLLLAVIATSAALTRSSGVAALSVIAFALPASLLWWVFDLENWWGVRTDLLPAMAVGLSALLFPKHFADAKKHLRASTV